MTDVFKQMREIEQAGARQEQQLAFQERIVKQLLRCANVNVAVGAMKKEALELRGSNVLDFDWLFENYPRFPLRMMSQKMRYTQTATIGDIYGKGQFRKLPWWREYEEQSAIYNVDLARDRAALVFNLPYAKDAFLMVLHNQPIQDHVFRDAERRQDEPWPRTTFPIGKTGLVAVLESLDSFIQTVGTDWAEQ